MRTTFRAAMKRAVLTAVLVSDEPAGPNEGWSRLAWQYGDSTVRVGFGVAETAETASLGYRRYQMALSVGTSPVPNLADEAFIVGPTNSRNRHVHFRLGRVNVEVSAPGDRIVLCPFQGRELANCEPTASRPALNFPPLPWQGPNTFEFAETAIRFAALFDGELKQLSARPGDRLLIDSDRFPER